MVCSQCGSPLALVDESGGVESGRFTEVYECVGCQATGTLRGDAEYPPASWDKTGSAFE